MNPIIALIIANIIWGAASPIFKYALTNIPPFTLAFIRFFVASLCFLPFYKQFVWKNVEKKDIIFVFLGAFFGVTVNISFFFLGLQKSESINAPIIASAGPVFMYLISIFLLRERAKRNVFIGMIIALIGVLIIILSPVFLDGRKMTIGAVEGNIFFVIATLGSVLMPFFHKPVLEKMNALQITCIGFFLSSLLFIPFMMKELTVWDFGQLALPGVLGIVFGVFFSSALAYYLYIYGLGKIRVQEIGIFTYMDPVVAIIIAIPLLGEYPNAYFIIGSAFVLIGIFYAEKRIHWHPFHKIREH